MTEYYLRLCSTIDESSLPCDVKISRQGRKKEKKKKMSSRSASRVNIAICLRYLHSYSAMHIPSRLLSVLCSYQAAQPGTNAALPSRTSSPLLSSLVPSVSLSYSHCLPPPNRQPLLFSHSSFFLHPCVYISLSFSFFFFFSLSLFLDASSLVMMNMAYLHIYALTSSVISSLSFANSTIYGTFLNAAVEYEISIDVYTQF